MINSVYFILYKTLVFKSETGKRFKYEIYQSSDASTLTASVSYLDDFVPSINTWVVIEPELILPLEHCHPEHTLCEVLKHFNDRYATE